MTTQQDEEKYMMDRLEICRQLEELFEIGGNIGMTKQEVFEDVLSSLPKTSVEVGSMEVK